LSDREVQSRGDRFLPSGDESGTAPGDRPFRPDVEGLRAVAVLLVVFFHAGIPFLSGGYIGVDVFFVISGFVITGVLLRERSSTGRTSLLAFYGRRCRRIIPAASLVIVATVVMAYVFVGSAAGGRTATDGRWASVFLANFHFTSIGTDYLGSQLPPSPLQNFWTLSVEEQFYVVYPTLFLVLAGIRTRLALRTRLAIGLVLVIVGSLAFSVIDTTSHPTAAYFSPFTRAWELALGALVAVATPWLLKIPEQLAALATWLGIVAVVVAAVGFNAQTAYPGWLVTIPVTGAALIIAGGVRAPLAGVETLLGLPPFRWLGRLSYSLYLWHWPILVIVAEHTGRSTLPIPQSLAWELVALGASIVTYRVVENPIRHAAALLRIRWASVGVGAALVAITVGYLTAQTQLASASVASTTQASTKVSTTSSLQQVLRLVAKSRSIRTVPPNLDPPVAQAVSQPASNLGEPPASTGCVISFAQSSTPACIFGDRSSTHTMVLYGDSHAGMWFRALDDIAIRSHWRLVVLFKSACPAASLSTWTRGRGGKVKTRWQACDQWHRWALVRINQLDPDLLIVTQELNHGPNGFAYTPKQWQRGLQQFLDQVTAPKTAKVVLGNIPAIGGPPCLAQYVDDVQACAGHPTTRYNKAEQRAAQLGGARYINVTPWFCTTTCSSIIGTFDVYFNTSHVAVGYTRFLETALAQSLPIDSIAPSGAGT
jgi:peptidoglycan/LPS O-acetylase OafA/YrhL